MKKTKKKTKKTLKKTAKKTETKARSGKKSQKKPQVKRPKKLQKKTAAKKHTKKKSAIVAQKEKPQKPTSFLPKEAGNLLTAEIVEVVVEKNNEILVVPSLDTKDAKSERKKISRKKPGTKSVEYFDQYTQQAIVEYQKELIVDEKNKIYLEQIYPALDSLVENLINVYGFNVMYESREDLKNECLEFLYGTLPKFNAEKGSKAFSYFNVVAKNWLTIKSKQNSKRLQSYVSIDNKENLSQQDLEAIEGYSVAPDGEELMIAAELRDRLSRLIEEIGNKAKTDNEQSCIKAIKILVENIDDVDFLNKRAVLLYLREITGFSSKQLSILLASIKKHYKEAKSLEEFN